MKEEGSVINAVARVTAAYAAIGTAGWPEAWITLRPAADALAALNGIVGVKPTRGVIPCTGVVPASASLPAPALI